RVASPSRVALLPRQICWKRNVRQGVGSEQRERPLNPLEGRFHDGQAVAVEDGSVLEVLAVLATLGAEAALRVQDVDVLRTGQDLRVAARAGRDGPRGSGDKVEADQRAATPSGPQFHARG